MAEPINKRSYIARLGEFSRTCEAYSGAGRKRVDSSKPVVFGDGTSRTKKLRDPAMTVDPVTLRFLCAKNDPFVDGIAALAEKHRQNPESAGPLILQAFKDDGTLIASKTLVNAVIESYHWPDGDVNASGESILEVIVDPEDILP